MHTLSVTVNGTEHTAQADARTLLSDFLRSTLGLTGCHVGCDTSQCGACVVRVDGETVKSCAILAVQVDGTEITTIEGLADGEKLHPMQQAFRDHHALQCGFCTPGMVMAAVALVEDNPDPTDDEVRRGLEGNLCRCTGYVNIVAAVRAGAEMMRSNGDA